MTHAEFVAAYEAGRIRVSVNRDAASRFVAGNAMLPFVLLPVHGLGVLEVRRSTAANHRLRVVPTSAVDH